MIKRGVNIIPDVPMEQVVSLGVKAEELGFDKCWVYDEGLVTRDVYISLAAIAGKTARIQLGTGITSPYTRHPAVTASAIATLDEYSGGRAFLGIGAGGSLTLSPMAIERYKPLTAVRESLQAIRGLFRNETVTLEGEVVRLNQARMEYGRADIPIWLAGRGSKMLSLGGELADGVVLEFLHKQRIQANIDTVKAGAERSGNRPKMCYSTMIITNDRVLEELRPHMTYRLVDSPLEIKDMLGIAQDEIDKIHHVMVTQGLYAAGKLIKDEWISPFVIMGSPSACAQEIADIMTRYQFDEFLLPILETKTAVELMQEVSQVLGIAG